MNIINCLAELKKDLLRPIMFKLWIEWKEEENLFMQMSSMRKY